MSRIKKYYKLALLLIALSLFWVGMRLFLLKQTSTAFPLSLKWYTDLGSTSEEKPVFLDNLVLFSTKGILKNNWFGIDAITGRTVWSQQAQGRFVRCLSSDYLVISSGSISVLDPNTGAIIWQSDIGAEAATCNETILYSSSVPRSSIAASNLSNGLSLWSGTAPVKSFNGLSYNLDANEILASESTLPGDFYVVDPQSGKLKVSFASVGSLPYEDGHGAMYIVNQNELFIGGTVLDAQTGEVIHKEDFYLSKLPPTVTSDYVYLSAFSEGIVAFDRDTYTVDWIFQPQRKISWIPIFTLSQVEIMDGVGYAIFSDATLRAFDVKTGQELGFWQPGIIDLLRWPVCRTVPPHLKCFLGNTFFGLNTARVGLVASDDTLFVSFGNGKLYAFGKNSK